MISISSRFFNSSSSAFCPHDGNFLSRVDRSSFVVVIHVVRWISLGILVGPRLSLNLVGGQETMLDGEFRRAASTSVVANILQVL